MLGDSFAVLPPCTAHRIYVACFDAMDVGVLVQPYIVLPHSRGQFCPSWPHFLLAHRFFHYSQWGLHNNTSTSVAPSRVALVPSPSPRQAPCLPVTVRATRADCGPPRAPSRRPREKEGNARGPANRDGEDNVTRTSTTTATLSRVTPKAHRPAGSTGRSTRRRRKNPYQARGHIDAKYRQPRRSTTS